ncbi:Xaa-Pro aminopeptidase 2 [Phytophthora boehmeriae]|uniref:Xaa-Pro aminopeptidase 2 n=1 Tax=Phytophthora boehmeriae TaxID=109152 RepID=A0A8T1X724_9STRA|nr:Xaa-Pro aminopeptidase 2 [Phytophthora boehmeriae]
MSPQQKQRKAAPSEAIFNTQFTTAGKRFLTKIKKNRAMQVDRRTRGFQAGQEQRTVMIDPFTGSHYRVLVVDPDMQRRESLADDLEKRFEIFVAPSNERAFALLGLFPVNFILLHMDIGNDQTAATSPALAFLREMKRSCFRTPVAALVERSISTDHEAQKLLARALQQGGICGYFEEGLAPDIMAKRLAKLLRTLTVAQNELARCRESQADLPHATQTKSNAVSPEFLTCIQLDPSMHEAFFNLSVAQLKLGKDELALQALTHAIALDPQNTKYLHNRGLMYRRMGLFVQAQTEYSKTSSFTTASTSTGHRNARAANKGGLSKCEMEDGLFAHLFGKPTPDKTALACPANERSADMLGAIVARLQTLLFFQDFPREILTRVAQELDYDVVACGKSFALGEMHPQNFYVLLEGRLSVRRRVGTADFGSFVTTHHLEAGTVFGCAGFAISAQASLIADECTEIGLLWPDAYAATIRAVTSQTNHNMFAFLQELRGFRLLSTSELGHIVGISERKRFRKGDILLEQNENPRHLIVLWKGSCSVYQDFKSPPLCRRKLGRSTNLDEDDNDSDDDDDDDETDSSDEDDDPRNQRRSRNEGDGRSKGGPPPFHRLIAKPDWPLGFQTRTRARKYRRGRRDGLMLSGTPPLVGPRATGQTSLVLPVPGRRHREKLTARDKNALVQTCIAPAVFGESSLLDRIRAPSKCCVVAESLVEVLLFDHMRLQEMDLPSEMINELLDATPKYLSEKEVAQKQADVATWDEYKNRRKLELSKNRWPEAKQHLRSLSNGCSIMLASSSNTNAEPSK